MDWFTPLDGYLANDQLVDPGMLKKDGFAPAAYRALNVNSNQYALPIMAGAAILHYRIDVLDSYGIDAPPDTWAELEEVVKKVHTPDVVGVGMRGSKKGGNVGLMTTGSLVVSFPALLFALIMRTYLRKGVLGGAIKE